MTGTHFLLDHAARTLPLARAAAMSEDQAWAWFRRARWPQSRGKVAWCAHCGAEGAREKTRRRFVCRQAECKREFTVTSGTVFAHHKLKLKQLVLMLAMFTQSVKGKSALQASRELGVTHKPVWVWFHKLREALAAERDALKLTGTVELDGSYWGGYQRPANRAEDRDDRRLKVNRMRPRQCILVLTQRGDEGRTVATVVPGETKEAILGLVRRHVAAHDQLVADEADGYDILAERDYEVARTVHKVAYVGEGGESTNCAEMVFDRMRRGALGIYHRVSGRYLDWYAAEWAWRHDRRRVDFRSLTALLLSQGQAAPVSRTMANYWQGNKPEKLGYEPDG